MLLPEIKEREYRFKLALRMGIPIFILMLGIIYTTFTNSQETLQPAFYFELVLILVFSIYFIFFLIYNGFETRITESVSKTFTREYLYKFLQKDIKKEKSYTLILISIENLHSINEHYGIKNGDKVLYKTAHFIGEYLKEKGIANFPMGHIKGGDFILGLKGSKEEYKTILELFDLKVNDYKIDDIEIKISSAINDTTFSKELEHLVENLFELQNQKLILEHKNDLNPCETESYVINAIKTSNFNIQTQDIFQNELASMKECFIKLNASNGKNIYAKTYMKVLNKLGLMVDFDLMVLEDVILNHVDDKVVVLSISPTSLRNYKFMHKVKELIDDNVDAKGKIMFMLYENEYYSNIDKYNKILNTLRKIGIKIAIDRLGSIHTSFLYLRDLDVDAVRFDSYYTKENNVDKYLNIIKGYNEMAHNKDIKTWVKLVETQEVKDVFSSIQIDYMQGKYLANLT